MISAVSQTVLPLPTLLRRPGRPTVTVSRRVRPRPTVDLSRLTRYRGGTYSHTVEQIVFTDGSSARTDLIRLNPGVQAYSLDFSAAAPLHPSPYRVEEFTEVPNLRARAHEVEVDWILRNSYPNLSLSDISDRLREAGYPLGAGHLRDHEAIAATQAAIWHFTNGLDLDTRPLDEPLRLVRGGTGVTAEFDGQPELGGYSVEVAAAHPVTVSLHKSIDGRHWQEVAASRMTVTESGRKTLGVGATVSGHRYGRPPVGHRYYRVVIEESRGPVTLGDVAFWVAGSGSYRNADRIVHLYNHLVDGARRAGAHRAAPALDAEHVTVDSERGLIGPFRFTATSAAALTAGDAEIITADGTPITEPLEVGSVFYLRLAASDLRSVTVTMAIPGLPDGYGGRVLTGVARDQASHRLTPVALVVPVRLVVDFDITW